jgi:hypothetical protein
LSFYSLPCQSLPVQGTKMPSLWQRLSNALLQPDPLSPLQCWVSTGAHISSKFPSPNLFSRPYFLSLLYQVFLFPINCNCILQVLETKTCRNYNPSP